MQRLVRVLTVVLVLVIVADQGYRRFFKAGDSDQVATQPPWAPQPQVQPAAVAEAPAEAVSDARHNCFSVHLRAGCNNRAIEQVVCQLDPFCCLDAHPKDEGQHGTWDQSCVNAARFHRPTDG